MRSRPGSRLAGTTSRDRAARARLSLLERRHGRSAATQARRGVLLFGRRRRRGDPARGHGLGALIDRARRRLRDRILDTFPADTRRDGSGARARGRRPHVVRSARIPPKWARASAGGVGDAPRAGRRDVRRAACAVFSRAFRRSRPALRRSASRGGDRDPARLDLRRPRGRERLGDPRGVDDERSAPRARPVAQAGHEASIRSLGGGDGPRRSARRVRSVVRALGGATAGLLGVLDADRGAARGARAARRSRGSRPSFERSPRRSRLRSRVRRCSRA